MIWGGINARCDVKNTDDKNHRHYGGRGIRNLFADFEEFFRWSVVNAYEPGLQIDRINNDGHYEPMNCRWVDGKENLRNTSRTKLNPAKVVEIRRLRVMGLTHRAIAAEIGVTQSHVSNVLNGVRWADVV
jgi:hypothetical protein